MLKLRIAPEIYQKLLVEANKRGCSIPVMIAKDVLPEFINNLELKESSHDRDTREKELLPK